MLTYPYSSAKNIEVLPMYTDIVNKINSLGDNIKKLRYLHWIPLCIIHRMKNLNCNIRELDKRYLKSYRRDGVNLF
jgi:hypothetical protein